MFNRCKNRVKWNKWANVNRKQGGDSIIWQYHFTDSLYQIFPIKSFFWKTWSCQYNRLYDSCQHLAVYGKACNRTFSSCFRLLLKCFYHISLLGNIFPFRFLNLVFHWRFSVIFTVPSHSSCIFEESNFNILWSFCFCNSFSWWQW